MAYKLVNDRYGNHSEPFDSIDDFLAMCSAMGWGRPDFRVINGRSVMTREGVNWEHTLERTADE